MIGRIGKLSGNASRTWLSDGNPPGCCVAAGRQTAALVQPDSKRANRLKRRGAEDAEKRGAAAGEDHQKVSADESAKLCVSSAFSVVLSHDIVSF